jgi:hypothetical protein
MINLQKLKKVVQKDGKIEAQCPACEAAGADAKGNHLVVYPNGAFSCVANPDDKEHNRTILKLAGDRSAQPPPQLVIRREKIPEITTLMRIGRIGQKTPAPPPSTETPPERAVTEPAKSGPNSPAGAAAFVSEAPETEDTQKEVCTLLYGT